VATAASDASAGVLQGAGVDAEQERSVAGAGRWAARALDGQVLAAPRPLAPRVMPRAEPCKPDEDRSAARSCAAAAPSVGSLHSRLAWGPLQAAVAAMLPLAEPPGPQLVLEELADVVASAVVLPRVAERAE
jgi:hypothetical protein